MMKVSIVSALLALSGAFSACASPPRGPVVPAPPSVAVTRFQSNLITPDVIRFDARIEISNRMRAPLDIERVDYGADLHDKPLFEESFAELHPMRSRGKQWVNLPFQVSMKDVTNQIEDVLAEEGIRVAFRGTVYPVGFGPIPFEATRVIPVPRLPEVAIDGVQGSPLDGEFTVFLRVRNTNEFPMAFDDVDTFLSLNGKRYDLLRTESFSEMAPGGSGRVALTMHQTRGKGLSMVVNVVKHGAASFTVGGSISCRTPYGVILLPLDLSAAI